MREDYIREKNDLEDRVNFIREMRNIRKSFYKEGYVRVEI